jgi:hypothetical protein
LKNAFQKKPAGLLDCGVVKVTSDGSAVVWATWLGGSDNDTQEASIRVDAKRRVAIVLNTRSTDMPTTNGAHGQRPLGNGDGYVAMLTSLGQRGLHFGQIQARPLRWTSCVGGLLECFGRTAP